MHPPCSSSAGSLPCSGDGGQSRTPTVFRSCDGEGSVGKIPTALTCRRHSLFRHPIIHNPVRYIRALCYEYCIVFYTVMYYVIYICRVSIVFTYCVMFGNYCVHILCHILCLHVVLHIVLYTPISHNIEYT